MKLFSADDVTMAKIQLKESLHFCSEDIAARTAYFLELKETRPQKLESLVYQIQKQTKDYIEEQKKARQQAAIRLGVDSQ